VLMPYAKLIPMPVIAAILFVVAYNMSEWREFVHLVKTSPKSDILVLLVTFVLTVVFDLVVAIAVGIVLAAVLFMSRMSGVAKVEKKEGESDEKTEVYVISGAMFFGAADVLSELKAGEKTENVVVDMSAVSAFDATGAQRLAQFVEDCDKKGVKVIFKGVNEQPMKIFKKAGLNDKIRI